MGWLLFILGFWYGLWSTGFFGYEDLETWVRFLFRMKLTLIRMILVSAAVHLEAGTENRLQSIGLHSFRIHYIIL